MAKELSEVQEAGRVPVLPGYEKSIRYVKTSEDGTEWLVMAGKPAKMSEAEREAREKERKEARDKRKEQRAIEREAEAKVNAGKVQKHKEALKKARDKIADLNKEIKTLARDKNFDKANTKQDAVNELQKELTELKSLKKTEVYERF